MPRSRSRAQAQTRLITAVDGLFAAVVDHMRQLQELRAFRRAVMQALELDADSPDVYALTILDFFGPLKRAARRRRRDAATIAGLREQLARVERARDAWSRAYMRSRR